MSATSALLCRGATGLLTEEEIQPQDGDPVAVTPVRTPRRKYSMPPKNQIAPR
ncbi:hypothetical protein HAPAU_25990 [Halalkalicoccus paucihalophilus]|uniref:Uncharacterized protein n=1 Tax=Halalkalicoccus paucihalophilus TaxID=1008153 RepID=A0A151AE45_9EURY|nr:hypothetical protein HAPAU_25990 [Halalkalicoccus paucihalophilus]